MSGKPLRHDTVLNEGWAVGTTDLGEYLTVIGSRYSAYLVFPTAEAAEPRAEFFRERFHNPADVLVRKVRRLGLCEYLLIDTPATSAPGTALTEGTSNV
ncbi:hypothetical protein [Nocardia sp. MW-W600-9]